MLHTPYSILQKLILIVLLAVTSYLPSICFARDTATLTDWYVKDFQTSIVVSKDSTATITEKITADCGNLPGKHGIFRILPTRYKNSAGQMVTTPIQLVSITDFSGKPYKFETIRGSGTITFKIGDPNLTVTGVNEYKIVYKVKNIINFYQENDELFWNLSGNQWTMDIDKFSADVTFPFDLKSQMTGLNVYDGMLGNKTSNFTGYQINGSTLSAARNKTLKPGEGVSVQTKFKKGNFTPAKVTFLEKYGRFLPLALPIILLIICFIIWRKFGRDPKLNRTIVPEFAIPENLSPMEMGNILNNGSFNDKFITAELINLAVKGYIKIEEIPAKNILIGKDFRFTLINNDFSELKPFQISLINSFVSSKSKDIFSLIKKVSLNLQADTGKPLSKDQIIDQVKATTGQSPQLDNGQSALLSENKMFLSQTIQALYKDCGQSLTDAGYFNKSGFYWRAGMFVVAFFVLFLGIVLVGGQLDSILNVDGAGLIGSIIISIMILIFFAFLMPQRTEKGALILLKIKGFELYMKVAEKYRQQFNEKENIFEKFLPYAMVFGLTELWVNKMKQIYGDEYFNTYHPVWYSGYVGSFNANTLNDSISAISQSVATASSSGSGGSGGGGGGGGGGGW